ncbi:ArdC-like ssDNA-binding domain-containing protein [Botrimarina sp.]|uniref:ArdC-like ssDNA-binding domain-containing protein n=1 Tax=Botrimarina sp. TaxID=2795802 RepID=UPI0032EFB071
MPTVTKQEEKDPKVAEALRRAKEDKSHANYNAIINGFAERGVPEGEIKPRENVFTYNAWKALGRQVRRGEHGVKIFVVEKELRDRKTGKREKKKFTKRSTVFHVTQTDPIGDPQERPPGAPSPIPSPATPMDLPSPSKAEAPALPDPKLAAKFRDAADRLDAKIEHAERPETQNYTARRNSFYRSRLHDAACMRSTQAGLRALADAIDRGRLPPELRKLTTVKEVAAAMRLARKEVPNGYHPYVVTRHGEYVHDTPEARALQRLVEQGDAPDTEARRKAAEILEIETELRGQKLPGFFPTPRELAESVVWEAGIEARHEVLEPSAGIGSLAEVVRDKHPLAQLYCVERHLRMCNLLELKGFDVTCGDFLDVEGQVDRIVMNPPFENGQDITHFRHAYSLLKPGGRIVAIVSSGTLSMSGRQRTEFREWFHDLPDAEVLAVLADKFNKADAFKQTGVSVAVIAASA